MNLNELRALGFDLSTRIRGSRIYKVKCSCCAAVTVNGHPLHERGCSNDKHECAGCNALVPARVRYCEDCA